MGMGMGGRRQRETTTTTTSGMGSTMASHTGTNRSMTMWAVLLLQFLIATSTTNAQCYISPRGEGRGKDRGNGTKGNGMNARKGGQGTGNGMGLGTKGFKGQQQNGANAGRRTPSVVMMGGKQGTPGRQFELDMDEFRGCFFDDDEEEEEEEEAHLVQAMNANPDMPAMASDESVSVSTPQATKKKQKKSRNDAKPRVIEVQFFPDDVPIPFLVSKDPKNPNALSGTCLLDNKIDKHSYTDAPKARDEIGEINILFEEDGLMAGSCQMNQTIYQFSTGEDGVLRTIAYDLSKMPNDEDIDENSEDALELVKEASDEEDYHNGGERHLRQSEPRSSGRLRNSKANSNSQGFVDVNWLTANIQDRRLAIGDRGDEDQEFKPVNATDSETDPNNVMNGIAEEWIIDVMVPYTQRVLCAMAGAKSPKHCVPNGRRRRLVETRIHLAIQEANVAYKNSGIPGRLRLVHSYMIPSSEFDEQDYEFYKFILRTLAFPNDGLIDGVHSLRLEHRADVVTFLVDNPASCGLAYTGNPVARTWAFSVVNWICATGYYSFVHEISHHMGARHDRIGENCSKQKDQCCPANGECDRYGWQDPEHRFRSVMAYNCPVQGGCPRVQYFSQPSIPFPLLSANGSTTDAPLGDNYNNNARGIVSGFMALSAHYEHLEEDGTDGDKPPPTPNVCGNGICEPYSTGAFEDCETCPSDCVGGVFVAEECGNGLCEVGEDCLNCPDDCAKRLDQSHLASADVQAVSMQINDAYKYCCVGGPPDEAMVIAEAYVDFGVPCGLHPNCNFNAQCSEGPKISTSFCCGNGVCERGEWVWNCPTDCQCKDDGFCDPTFEDEDHCADCQGLGMDIVGGDGEVDAEMAADAPNVAADVEADWIDGIGLGEAARCMDHGRVCSAIRPDPCCGECNAETHRCDVSKTG